MTVPSATNKARYAGNGTTTAFPTIFKFTANADIQVVLRSLAGVETTLVELTHYTVTGAGVEAGGTVTMITSPLTGEVLTLLREIVITQEVDYVENDPFPAEVHEGALDKLTQIAQEQEEKIDRSIQAPISDTIPLLELPEASVRANNFLAFDAIGNVIPSEGTGADIGIRGDLASATVGKGASLVTTESGLTVQESLLAAVKPESIAPILTASVAVGFAAFGSGCALSSDGSVLVVGANFWDGAFAGQGAIHTYDWNGVMWVERLAVLTASDAGINDAFGVSCSLSADGAILAVGADDWDGAIVNQGAVYIYDWSGSAWVERSVILTASDGGINDFFGVSCALSDDGSILAVGAYAWEGTKTDQGAVYIFDWSGSAWVERSVILTASDAAQGDFFGYGCALSSDGLILAVGASLWEGVANNQGAVYIFDWSGSAWVERSVILTASDASTFDTFGYSCSLSADGSVLAVGAVAWTGAITNQGSVYLYDWDGTVWTERISSVTASDAGMTDNFGASCALSGDGSVLVGGAISWDGAQSAQGAVYTYGITLNAPGNEVVLNGAGLVNSLGLITARVAGVDILSIDSAAVTVKKDTLRIATQKTPASATATGVKGDIVHDANYIYVCTATNVWKRVAIATW